MYEGIARLIADRLDDLVYDETQGANVFLDRMASAPDRAVALYTRAAIEPDSKLPYDPVEFQIVVRSESDATWALATGRAIYAIIHGMRNTTLPDGTYAVFVLAQSAAPFSIGDDENARPQFSWDYRGETLNPTEERDA